MGVNGNRGGVHRRSHPSGAWVDRDGNPVPSPYGTATAEPTPRSTQAAPKLPNPDPYNFVVQEAEQIGSYLVVKVQYPDCTNYEGVKILVYAETTALDLLKQRFLDPHFFEAHKTAASARSPVARFVPTPTGWHMATRFATMMGKSP